MKKNYNVYIPQERGRNKTAARGFWYSQDSKRTYYDYIKPEDFAGLSTAMLKKLCLEYKQEAIFYTVKIAGAYTTYEAAHIYTATTGNVETLTTKKVYSACGKKSLRAQIKDLLKTYGGLTVFKDGNGLYSIEAWTK